MARELQLKYFNDTIYICGKHKEMVDIIEGKKIEVTFNHPCSLQIDGETIRNVTSYVAEID